MTAFILIAILCFIACFTPLIVRIGVPDSIRLTCFWISSLGILMIFVIIGLISFMRFGDEILKDAFGKTPYFYIMAFGLAIAASGEPYNQLINKQRYNLMLVPYYVIILSNLTMSMSYIYHSL